jgi:hypothetical protein
MEAALKTKATILPPEVINELVSASFNYSNEILSDISEMIETEKETKRKDLLTKIKDNVVKERDNFRVLSRQIEEKADQVFQHDGRVAETNCGLNKFTLLPEKLAVQLASELQVKYLSLGHIGNFNISAINGFSSSYPLLGVVHLCRAT